MAKKWFRLWPYLNPFKLHMDLLCKKNLANFDVHGFCLSLKKKTNPSSKFSLPSNAVCALNWFCRSRRKRSPKYRRCVAGINLGWAAARQWRFMKIYWRKHYAGPNSTATWNDLVRLLIYLRYTWGILVVWDLWRLVSDSPGVYAPANSKSQKCNLLRFPFSNQEWKPYTLW